MCPDRISRYFFVPRSILISHGIFLITTDLKCIETRQYLCLTLLHIYKWSRVSLYMKILHALQAMNRNLQLRLHEARFLIYQLTRSLNSDKLPRILSPRHANLWQNDKARRGRPYCDSPKINETANNQLPIDEVDRYRQKHRELHQLLPPNRFERRSSS